MKLNDRQFAVLNKLAKLSGMECWFCVAQDAVTENDYVMDLDSGSNITLKEGVSQLNEGLTSAHEMLNEYEYAVYCHLLGALGIELPVIDSVLSKYLEKFNVPWSNVTYEVGRLQTLYENTDKSVSFCAYIEETFLQE